MNIFLGVFLVLHGLVHMWYVTLSQGWVAFQADMGWTGQSWLLSGSLSEGGTKWLATLLYVLTAVAFTVSGAGKMIEQDWARSWIVVSAIISTVAILVFWDGNFHHMVEKGLLGLVIDFALLAWILWSA